MATATRDPKHRAASSSSKGKGKPKAPPPKQSFHPDEYRMTIGEHLEELRTRLVLGLIGFAVAVAVCMVFGEQVTWYFCLPLTYALDANKLPPTLYQREVSESFMVYIKISMITAAAFASPWMLYQVWQFVAAGLYPKERKYITKYLPYSITLLITGMVFLYYLVLPLMLKFFIAFSIGPAIGPPNVIDPAAGQQAPIVVPMLQGNPASPVNGQIWMDLTQHRLKFFFDGDVRVLPFGSDQLVTPNITLSDYIDMVINMLLSFGLAFQTPLVVLALVRIGIVDVPALKSARRYVYFATSIIAGVIVPDVVGGMIALMIPLMLLFEFGLWLARDPNAPKVPLSRRLGNAWRWVRVKKNASTLFRYLAVAALAGLLIHIMTRERQKERPAAQPPAATKPAQPPPATPLIPTPPPAAPATLPTTVPATQPVGR